MTILIAQPGVAETLPGAVISTSLESARRLIVTKQHLAGKPPKARGGEAILSVMRDLGYVQLDPINVVAPSHVIALWSRLGSFRAADLERLLWVEKRLFEHWSHAASIVLTEDYPIYYSQMRRYPESLSISWGGWRERARRFLAQHADLRKRVLNELKKGPRRLSEVKGHAPKKRSDGWGFGSEVSTMLFHLQMRGEVMVVGHDGNQKVWGLSEEFLPSWVERKELSAEEVEREGAERTIRALGIASASEINLYLLRGQYHNLKGALDNLREESTIHRVRVAGLDDRGDRYIHERDVPILESMDSDAWQPRMSLLSPLDNLVYSRTRTARVFGFDYATEIYTPQDKRKFGYYVMPILWGGGFIGRVDPQMDRANERLLVHSVHAEPGAPRGREVSSEVAESIGRLAEFLGAKEIVYTARVPAAWRRSLR